MYSRLNWRSVEVRMYFLLTCYILHIYLKVFSQQIRQAPRQIEIEILLRQGIDKKTKFLSENKFLALIFLFKYNRFYFESSQNAPKYVHSLMMYHNLVIRSQACMTYLIKKNPQLSNILFQLRSQGFWTVCKIKKKYKCYEKCVVELASTWFLTNPLKYSYTKNCTVFALVWKCTDYMKSEKIL